MLEFIKDCNQTIVFERARDCEVTLKAFNAITTMATFIETLFRKIYMDFNSNVDDYTIRNLAFADLLQDSVFTGQLKNKYGITNSEISLIDGKIRRFSNDLKHGTNPSRKNDQQVKECFQVVFSIAGKYYAAKTHKEAPAWSEEKYQELLDNAVDTNARKQREAEAKALIDTLKAENAKAQEEAYQAKTQVSKLTDELTKLRKESISVEDFQNYQKKAEKLETALDKKDSEIVLIGQRERAAIEERDKAKRELDELRESVNADTEEAREQIKVLENKYDEACEHISAFETENARLNDELAKLTAERAALKKELEEKSDESPNRKIIDELQKRVHDAELATNAALEKLNETEKKLVEAQAKLYDPEDPIARLNVEFQSENLQIYENTPECPHCRSKLILAPSKKVEGTYYWRCPAWPVCKGITRDVTEAELPIAELILGRKTKNGKRYSLPPEIIEGYKPDVLSYENYQQLFGQLYPREFLFQSLSVPKELFKKRKELGLDYYSRFRLISTLDKQKVNPNDRLLYSLTLRVLNRGVVLQSYEKTNDVLRKHFNNKNIGNTSALFNSICYDSPALADSAKREIAFASYYFKKLLGPSWASYVYAQAPISAIIPDVYGSFKEQKVDFLVSVSNTQKVVVELDGPEHRYAEKYDAQRDSVLKRNGYTVLRFRNDQVDARDPAILSQLSAAIGDVTATIYTDVDDKYLAACKLSHQFAVAIVKSLEQGFIQPHSNLSVQASTTLFTESEISFIFATAVTEVYDLLQNYSRIYGVNTSYDFFDKNGMPVTFFVGDGPQPGESGVLIRDIFLPYNFLCELEEFEWDGKPLSPDRTSVQFFLQYIFGYPDFQPGQFNGIERLMRQKDSIILLPTGAGKSMIYQLSSYIVPGMIFVVSPLVSLMEDQVVNLSYKFGITGALYFAAATTKEDKERKTLSQKLMQRNTTSLIYCAPERLQIPDFRASIASLLTRNNVYAVAIDEAHCVSEWGHDFRPSYLNIGNSSRRMFKKNGISPVLIALTGTASDAVLNDVRKDLSITGSDALVRPTTFDRKELHFSIVSCPTVMKANRAISIIKKDIPEKFGQTYEEFIKREKEKTNSGIVFTPYARGTSQYSAYRVASHLSDSLPEMGISTYFSSVPQDFDEATWKTIIRENARQFKTDEINMLVATKAFGMGIDKPNIRFIIHSGLPTSFEEYYQEAGRAGRDGNDSQCVLLFSNDDDAVNEKLLGANLTRDEFQRLYEESDQLGKFDNDDLSSLLMFHTGTFEGVDVECKQINEILSYFNPSNMYKDNRIAVFIPLVVETTEDGKKVVTYRGTTEKNWMRALVRLEILGVVQDYSYDYRGNFSLLLGDVNRDSIAWAFEKYIRSSNKDVVASNLEKINSLSSEGVDFIKDVTRILVEYIYETIEQSRRAAIRGMYYMAKEAAQKQGEEQNQFIRETIVSYFTYSGENRDELSSISVGENAGLDEVIESFDLGKAKSKFTANEVEKAKSTYVLAGRMLESKPDHPGLLLTQAIAKTIATNKVDTSVTSNVIAAVRYAKSRYSVDAESIMSAFSSAMNVIVQNSCSGFEEIIDATHDDLELSKTDLLEALMKSEAISDEGREYILLSYAAEISKLVVVGG